MPVECFDTNEHQGNRSVNFNTTPAQDNEYKESVDPKDLFVHRQLSKNSSSSSICLNNTDKPTYPRPGPVRNKDIADVTNFGKNLLISSLTFTSSDILNELKDLQTKAESTRSIRLRKGRQQVLVLL